LARKQGGPAEEWNRFEQKQLEYHQRVRQGYLELAAAEPARWLVVDAAGSVESVHRQLAAAVAERNHLPTITAE
jgi:dTMP kinase